MRRNRWSVGIALSRVGPADGRAWERTRCTTQKFRRQSVEAFTNERFLQICSHMGRAAVRIAFADGYAQIMLPFMLPWCSSELLLMAWSGCSRVAAMGAALIGSASLAHSSCMINMVSSWTRAYAALKHCKECMCVWWLDVETMRSPLHGSTYVRSTLCSIS